MSNFDFLQPEWPELHAAAHKVEAETLRDPRAACFYARLALEQAVTWIYKSDRSLKHPYNTDLAALIHEPSFQHLVGSAVFAKANILRKVGNNAVHGKNVSQHDALTCVRELFHICYWIARTYASKNRPDPELTFDATLLPAPLTAAKIQQFSQQLKDKYQQEQDAAIKAKDAELAEVLSSHKAMDEELRELRAQIAATKQANREQVDTHDYTEEQTRDYFIDLLLREAGWDLQAVRDFEIEIQGMPNQQGVGFVDYVLWGDNGLPLAVIEAKRTKRNPLEGERQAELYANCLEKQYGQRPIIFLSNGYEHRLWDDANYPAREVQGFLKKDELERMIQRRTTRKSLATGAINTDIAGRYYQTRAIRRIGETFERDHARKALIVMATGAGKTRTVIALADLLMRNNWAKRVLFLADRVALVNQAVGAFKKYLPDAAPVNLVTEKNTEGRVYVSTYPTMMGLIDDVSDEKNGGVRRFGVGHFDLIIVDEAHRSIYQKYQAIFNYFDALLVGLTATPKDEIDFNTYRLFGLETGVPTDAYALDQAVADHHLVPPRAISVPLKFQREGISYDQLSEEEQEQWDSLDWGDEEEPPDGVDPAALNQWLFNVDTVDRVLKHLWERGQRVAGGDVLGKTIIFAKNNAHAEFIADRFNANFRKYKGHFARVITHKTEYAQSLIDAFSKKDSAPHIAISVDMLDTGIDVPEVVNLVFFKIVRSKTKFWQMLGRGTRLCPDLFAPGVDKEFFYIFDYCQNLEYFNQDAPISEGSATESLSARLFKTRLGLIAGLDEQLKAQQPKAQGGATSQVALTVAPYGQDVFVRDELQLRSNVSAFLHEIVSSMNVNNFVVRPQRRSVEKYANAVAWKSLELDDLRELATDVANLPSELTESDEDAKRFDLMVLKSQLGILQQQDISSIRTRIQDIAASLELQDAIPSIRAQMVLIQALSSEEWWQDVTAVQLENMRTRLRGLIRLIEKKKRVVVYTDFQDELGESTVVDLPAVSVGLNMAKFKEKARQFLHEHEDHIALKRLRRNQALTALDLSALDRMLHEAGGSDALIAEVKSKNNGLAPFVRSLVGLEREAVLEAFAGFVNDVKLTANQIEFVELIITELTQTGVMEVSRLYESPFSDLSPEGPDGLFASSKVDQMVQVLESFQLNAVG